MYHNTATCSGLFFFRRSITWLSYSKLSNRLKSIRDGSVVHQLNSLMSAPPPPSTLSFLRCSLVVFPVQMRYRWYMKNPSRVSIIPPTTTEQIIMTTVPSTADPLLAIRNMMRLASMSTIVMTTVARKDRKYL